VVGGVQINFGMTIPEVGSPNFYYSRLYANPLNANQLIFQVWPAKC
jgi:hypothetical protein